MRSRSGKQLELVEVIRVFNAVTIAPSGDSTSDVITLYDTLPSGFFSLQISVSGDGTAKFEVYLSNDGVTYCGPVVCKSDGTTTTIVTGVLKTGGQNGDGNGIYPFSPAVAAYMRIKASETAGVNAIVVSAWLAAQ